MILYVTLTDVMSDKEGKNECMGRLASVTGLYLICCTGGGDKGKPRASVN